ncbi:Pca regulon regulatory protein [compost metagenome]
MTPFTKTDEAAIRAELALVAAQGYALVDQEFEVGMRVLAVPLYGRGGRLQATLSITTHASRLSLEEMRLRYLLPLYEAQALLKPVLD